MQEVNFASDHYAEQPLLGFDNYADRIANLMKKPAGGGAFVFAIHGRWGSGKTTLMHAVEQRLKAAPAEEDWCEPLVVRFNAWKYQDREVLWRAFLLRVIGEIEGVIGENQTQVIRESLYRAFEVEERGPLTVDYKKLVVEIVGAILKLWNLGFLARFGKIFQRPAWFGGSKDEEEGLSKEDAENFMRVFTQSVVRTHIHKVESIEQFLEQFEKLVEQLRNKRRRLVVTVDDLDRCLPESTLEIFEAIKLFMDVNGVKFIICLDRDVIRKALRVRYERISGAENFVDPDEYVEKAITLSFHIPLMSRMATEEYLDSLPLSDRWTELCREIMKTGLEPNPRRIKRFANGVELLFDLIHGLEARVPDELTREYLVKLYVLEYRWSGFYEAVAERPEALLELVKLTARIESYQNVLDEFKKQWPRVALLAEDRDLFNFLKQPPLFSGLDLGGLQKVITFLALGNPLKGQVV